MTKYFVLDKATKKSSILLLAKSKEGYQFVNLTDCVILDPVFRTPSKALKWLDIGYAWENIEY